MPSKVTVSSAAPQRAQIETKSSGCLQGLIQRPLKPKIPAEFNPFTSGQAHNYPTHSFDLIYIFRHQLSDFLKSVSTAPYRTAQLSTQGEFTSQRRDNTAQRGLLSFIYPESPGTGTCLGETALLMPSSLPIATSGFAPSRLRVHCFMPNGNTKLGTKTKSQVL